MPTITITTSVPSVSSEGKYDLVVDYTHATLTDLGLQYKIDAGGDWVDFTAGASPDTLTIEGLQSDGVAHTVYLQHEGDAATDNDAYTSPANDVSAGVKIYFDADSDSATNGKIVVRITNGELVAMNYFVGVLNSVGTIKAVNVGSADITAVPSTASAYFTAGDIDTSKSGIYLSDNYTFDIRSQFGAATPIAIPVDVYLFDPLLPTAACSTIIDWAETVNTIDGIISFLDSTDYTGYTIVSRAMSVIYPQITGVATPTTVTSSGSTTVSATITYLNVTYSGTLENLIRKSSTGTNGVQFEYNERFERRKDVPISIYTDLCEVSACIKDEFARLDTAACAAGGFDKMSSIDKHKFYDLSAQMNLWAMARQCNDKEKMNTVVAAIKAKMPSDCGCPDGDNVPVAFTANPYLSLFSGSNLGGGARPFIEIDGLVFEYRTLTAGNSDITVAESGNNIVITNVQPIVFSIVEFDANSVVGDVALGEVFVPVPSVWNGKTIVGMMCQGNSGAGTCDVNVLINDVAATSATVTAASSAGVEQTFTTPITLATNDTIKLEIENTSGTLNGLSASLWIA